MRSRHGEPPTPVSGVFNPVTREVTGLLIGSEEKEITNCCILNCFRHPTKASPEINSIPCLCLNRKPRIRESGRKKAGGCARYRRYSRTASTRLLQVRGYWQVHQCKWILTAYQTGFVCYPMYITNEVRRPRFHLKGETCHKIGS